jgi:tRNA-splicing ligase RtcB
MSRELREQGTLVRGRNALAEESPGAYKDVERVIRIMSEAGIVAPVARLKPMVCIKG